MTNNELLNKFVYNNTKPNTVESCLNNIQEFRLELINEVKSLIDARIVELVKNDKLLMTEKELAKEYMGVSELFLLKSKIGTM